MVRAGADLGIARHRFHAYSRGTKDCVRKAPAAGIPDSQLIYVQGGASAWESLDYLDRERFDE